MARMWLCLVVFMAVGAINVPAQSGSSSNQARLTASMNSAKTETKMETTEDWNRRLQELVNSALSGKQSKPSPDDYRIGPDDELAINVLEAPDLSVAVRVAADGTISLPLLGSIRAEGLTSHELQLVLQALLRRTYMKDPQVTVTIVEMQSHSVTVLGAVKNPGIFQIRGTKTLLEMLSMAGGLMPDAGNAVLVMRGGNASYLRRLPTQSKAESGAKVLPASAVSASEVSTSSGKLKNEHTLEVSLKRLLDTGDPKYNVAIYPGDIIKVKAAGIIYVVGDVKRPGGFPVKDNEHITVLQAIALGEGMAQDANKSKAKIIRVAENGQQIEVPVHLNKILSGKAADIPLRPKDILFIPKNGAKAMGRTAFTTMSQWLVWRAIP